MRCQHKKALSIDLDRAWYREPLLVISGSGHIKKLLENKIARQLGQ